MSDYIKREDAVRRIAVLIAAEAESDGYEDQPMENYIEYASEDLADIPSADVVPVVRCKDCKYWDKDTLRHNSNDVAEWDECECEMLANRDRWNEIDRYCCDIHFCADGERKDDEID